MTAGPAAGRELGAPRGEVRVYCAPIASFDAHASLALLTPDDTARLAELTRARRRTAYVAGRALLRLALRDYTGRPAEAHRLRIGPNGKPECVDGPAISVSHGAELVACAIAASGPIGIDVETPSARRRAHDIAHDHFSAAEREWLGAGPADRFYMLWVLKEAYLKATGLGLGGGLDALECHVEPPLIGARAKHGRAALALYRAGASFLGIAAAGRALVRGEIGFANPLGGGALPPIDFVAATP